MTLTEGVQNAGEDRVEKLPLIRIHRGADERLRLHLPCSKLHELSIIRAGAEGEAEIFAVDLEHDRALKKPRPHRDDLPRQVNHVLPNHVDLFRDAGAHALGPITKLRRHRVQSNLCTPSWHNAHLVEDPDFAEDEVNHPADNAREHVEAYVGRIEPVRPNSPGQDGKPVLGRVEENGANPDAGYAAGAELEQLSKCFPTQASRHPCLYYGGVAKNGFCAKGEDGRSLK